MRLVVFVIALFCSVWTFSQSDFETVQLRLPKDAVYTYSQIEPSIAIDPNNPNHIAVGSVLSDYYYSTNGGKKWKSKTLTSKFGVYGDPVLMFDKKSRLYYFHLSSNLPASHLSRIVCQSTEKLCKGFNEGTFPKPNCTKVQDKHWTVLNQDNNEIYMTWTQFDAYDSSDPKDTSIIVFSKSKDQGLSWSDPLRISKFGGDCLDGDNTAEGAVPAVGPNGEIYVAWAGPKGLVFQRSLDGGTTWLDEEVQIQRQYGGWDLDIPGVYRANGLPILKCDLSNGPNRGTLYLNWCDQKNGENDTDSWLLKSTDGGETWSKRIKVNQDGLGSHQFFTWIAIDRHTGYLYFVYYDRRNYNDTQTDVYISTSRDGGETFVDTRVSKSPFIPNPNLFFGDYLNIDAVNGVIRPIWPRVDNGTFSLWIALVQEDQLFKSR
ncbi:MAG: sialidase family protein [Crocinitomicaceae bacterium]|nr:sialidase family protein [Crocinitomicaceae bacterium]MDG1777436.1 sialidase family protein [Crocinitomicaceae bacterium]